MGHFSDYCYNSKRSIVSVDIGKSKMRMAKNNYPFLSFVQADAEEIPLKNNSFDVVVSIDLIEHLFDQNSHFKEVNRILKDDGGLYIIKTPNKIYDLFLFYDRGCPTIIQQPTDNISCTGIKSNSSSHHLGTS